MSTIRVISGLVMENYAISMQFVAVLPVVFGYMLAWATNTCFLLGARWNWITRMYWVMDLVTGLVIFTPLFIISIFRVRWPPRPARHPAARAGPRMCPRTTLNSAGEARVVVLGGMRVCVAGAGPVLTAFRPSACAMQVCDSVHMRLLYNSKVLDILERAKAQKTIEHDLPMRRKAAAGFVRQRSSSQSPLDPSPLIPSPATTRRGGVQ
jgi:hypothetical protein